MLEIQTSSSANANKLIATVTGAALLTGGALWEQSIEPPHFDILDSHKSKELVVRFKEGRSGDLQWKTSEKTVEKLSTDVLEPSEMVNTVIGALGLGMTDLEKVLKVKRATIYNWRKGGDVRAEDSLARLLAVYGIAKDIAKFNDRPFGKRAKTHQVQGKSYLDLLSNESLDNDAIINIARVLSGQENARLKAKNETSHEANDIDNLSGGWLRV
ncbi:hypothetical protein AB4209_07440 [Vibrio sp. 10N.286.48.C11]|uniref:hypothetical protein n=1 Tax=Vibrio sp. 10N.286.48.C11 TaxID=3229698 RepID=UPI002A6F0731|nr:hypothetical protein VCRA2114E122_90198 [Vibrio crassostreae]CAK2233941.1 hypothetical protein VCRA2114E123_90197 [Vibrio crassostreae]CAK3738775.1 hypothetical protein VCRA2126O133_90004 [Vibrio crassostreae]